MAVLSPKRQAGTGSRSSTTRPRPDLPLILLASLAAAATSPARADDAQAVAAIESAYLTKFAPFVEWPPTVDATMGPPTLCMVGDERIAGLTEAAEARLQPSGSRTIVRRLATETSATGCQILFAGGPEGVAMASVPAAEPVLTVTNEATQGHKGIVNFVIVDDRVRFEIDDAEAARRGLRISSKLLSLAVSVKPRA
jgi:hypothetical protein